MKSRFRPYWNDFKSVPPGARFQQRYARKHAKREAARWWTRCAVWGAGLVLILIGAFFCLVPGPGIPFLLLGGTLLAGESRVMARGLDSADVSIRCAARWGARLWHNMSFAPRVAVVLVALLAGAGVAYTGFRIFFDRA